MSRFRDHDRYNRRHEDRPPSDGKDYCVYMALAMIFVGFCVAEWLAPSCTDDVPIRPVSVEIEKRVG